jgi:CBS domain-containing protein
MDDINKLKVKQNTTIREALKQMDEAGIGFCVTVNDNDTVMGVLSDGDFRRAILNDIGLDENISLIENKKFLSVGEQYTKAQVDDIFNNSVVQHIPIIENSFLIDVITEESFYGIDKTMLKNKLNQSVVIMAGGKGARLDPFTRILPKPLIPIGDDPILKLIMDEFKIYSIDDFYITLNDKSKMISNYSGLKKNIKKN